MKIKDMITMLEENRANIHKTQKMIEEILPDRYCRNRGTHSGWCVPGNGAWTQAVNGAAHFRSDSYWSGSSPTPSTQYPLAYAAFLEKLEGKGSSYQDRINSILSTSTTGH